MRLGNKFSLAFKRVWCTPETSYLFLFKVPLGQSKLKENQVCSNIPIILSWHQFLNRKLYYNGHLSLLFSMQFMLKIDIFNPSGSPFLLSFTFMGVNIN